MRYAMLVAPSTNRVYADAAPRLARAELAVFGEYALGGRLAEIEDLDLGGVAYVGFTVEGGLSERDLRYLSNASAMFALFERAGDLLRPVVVRCLDRYDDDLVTIPKYAGKTNEQFTKLLLNVTVLAAGRDLLDDRLTVCDPLAGRGTTLNQALMYGYDAVGVEVDGKDVDAYAAFLRTYLRRKRIKHQADLVPVRRERRLIGRRFEVTLAPSRDAYKSGATQHLSMCQVDTTHARDLLRARSVDVIVTDAPYGVAHGSRAEHGLSRRPTELLRAALPGWVELLRPGGAIGMAFNAHTADRDELASLLAGQGLRVVPLDGFEHWVDQSINRDIIVATGR